MRIKKGDECKVVFSTPESVFELIVIFFGLTSSLATFQAMINDLLRDVRIVNNGFSFIFLFSFYFFS